MIATPMVHRIHNGTGWMMTVSFLQRHTLPVSLKALVLGIMHGVGYHF